MRILIISLLLFSTYSFTENENQAVESQKVCLVSIDRNNPRKVNVAGTIEKYSCEVGDILWIEGNYQHSNLYFASHVCEIGTTVQAVKTSFCVFGGIRETRKN